MPGDASGFAYEVRRSGDVVVTHHGRRAVALRAGRAAEFLAEVEGGDAAYGQQVMARWTGNYRRGNERTGKDHPRNRGR
jgi:hypothetical protein